MANLVFNLKEDYSQTAIKSKGIYKITNTINGKFYIGSAGGRNGFNQRWLLHKNTLNRGIHTNDHLQRAWFKYGEKSFVFEILELVPNNILIEREQYYLDLLKPYDKDIGYNIASIAHSNLYVVRSAEFKKRVGDIHRGKKLSQETKDKMSKAKKAVAGIRSKIAKLTDEQATEIRRLFNNDNIKQLAEIYNISHTIIRGIIYNEFYEDINYIPPIKIKRIGENAKWAKLTNQQAYAIREEYHRIKPLYKELAIKYNVSTDIIAGIIKNKTYIKEDFYGK